jgi:hypothetical protein
MTETGIVAPPCSFCRGPSAKAVKPRPFYDWGPADERGHQPMIDRPLAWVCDSCAQAMSARELQIGWCARCRGWGELLSESPCSGIYDEPKSLILPSPRGPSETEARIGPAAKP